MVMWGGFSTVHHGCRIKGLGQVHERYIQTYVLFSEFLLYLPQHEDHMYGPSVGPKPTLAFWRFFLCYRRDGSIQLYASLDVACNGERSDASVVWTVWFFSRVFVRRQWLHLWGPAVDSLLLTVGKQILELVEHCLSPVLIDFCWNATNARWFFAHLQPHCGFLDLFTSGRSSTVLSVTSWTEEMMSGKWS